MVAFAETYASADWLIKRILLLEDDCLRAWRLD
jgi:hypothetical protein